MEFKQAVVTQNGRALMAKLLAGKSTQFTKIKVSSTIYPDAQLANLTALTNIKQETSAQAYENNTATVSVVGAIENTGLGAGYYINTVGLYAVDPDKGEILYSVSSASVNGYMPPDTGVSKSGFEFKIYTEVGNATKVDLTVDPAAFATHEDIERLEIHQAWMAENDGEGFSMVPIGENLLNNSSKFTDTQYWKPNENVTLSIEDGCLSVYRDVQSSFRGVIQTIDISPDLIGKVFYVSTTVKNAPDSEAITARLIIHYLNSEGKLIKQEPLYGAKPLTSDFQKLVFSRGVGLTDPQTAKINIMFTVTAEGVVSHLLHKDFKVEFNDKSTAHVPSKHDDPVNCYPKYVGFGIKSSNNYQDYRWILNPEWVNANAMYGTGVVTMKDQLADIQDWIQAHS